MDAAQSKWFLLVAVVLCGALAAVNSSEVARVVLVVVAALEAAAFGVMWERYG